MEESTVLEKKLPPKSLLSGSMLFSLIGQPLILGLSVLGIYLTLKGQGFFDPNEKGELVEGKTTTLVHKINLPNIEAQQVTTIFMYTLPLYIYIGLILKSSTKFMKPIFEQTTRSILLTTGNLFFGLC